tara:strand:- start:141 stop:659 length:519 start_codon:yes stop_codon:yes gene_type:complete
MRGLPYTASEADVTSFFSGLKIAQGGVSIGHETSGRATGEAHIEFATEGDAAAAMALHRQRMGSRYIELFRTKQVPGGTRGRPGSAAGGADGQGTASDCLRLRGLPFSCTEADVQGFFQGYTLAPGGIKVGPHGGQGTVRFTSAEEARRAMASLNHGYMGNRYIELFFTSSK